MTHEATTPVEKLEPGTIVGARRYVIESVLGQGGVATVYRARTQQNESIALKVMLHARALDHSQRQRFANESKILEGLSGVPYVVELIECGRLSAPDSRPYIAMELLRGPTLDWMLNVERLSQTSKVHRACHVLWKVADAIADLHQRGIVHRDIKPDNIVVERDETIRILDFGYAHSQGEGALPDTAGLTMAEHRPGTYLYMAPEQALGFSPKPAFDIYALAVTLYEALVGRAPNHDLPIPDMARLKCEPGSPELSISGRVFGLPPQLEALVDDGLRRDPTERIATATDFRDRLGAVLKVLDAEVIDSLPVATPAAPPTKRAPREVPRLADSNAMTARPSAGLTEVAPAASTPAVAIGQRPEAVPLPRKYWLVPLLGVAALVLAGALWMLGRQPADSGDGRSAEQSTSATDGAPPLAVAGTLVGTSYAAVPDVPPEAVPDVPPEVVPDVPPQVEHPEPAPTKPRPKPRAEKPCEDVMAQSSAASTKRQWAKVLQLTRSSRCWTDQGPRRLMRMDALAQLKRYRECVEVGRGSSHPAVVRQVQHCAKQLERTPQ